MKGKGRFVLVFAVCLAAVLLLCGTAGAEGQTNPRRQHVLETLQWRNEKTDPEYYLASPYLTITCDRKPTLATPGKFTFTINNDDGSDWILEYGVSDTGRDPNGYTYFSHETTSRTLEDLRFYTAGDYRLYVYLYRKSGNTLTRVDRRTFNFTVAADPAYPTIEEKAQTIVNQCKVSGNTWQTALNIHDWLTHNMYYDLNYEYYGADAIFRGKGVCDSYSKAFKLLCTTAGITVDRVTSNAQNHAWNAIQFGSDWYQVDVTWDDPSGGTDAVSGNENYNYFCLSDEVMFLDHTHYDVSFDPGCNAMELNYFIKKNLWEKFGIYSGYPSYPTVIGYFQDRMEQWETDVTFDMNNWQYYYPGDGYGHGLRTIWYGIYVSGMRLKNWTLNNGVKLNIAIDWSYSDRYITMTVLGYEIPETKALRLPAGTTTIYDYAFEGIAATTVVIPNGCTLIRAGAFRNSSVTTVYVPPTLVSISPTAFSGCPQIHFRLLGGENTIVRSYAEKYGYVVD